MVRRRLLLTCALLLGLSGVVSADEGMWPTYALGSLPFDSLRSRGLQIARDQICDPQGGGLAQAVVQMGATASFVSPQGLLITNHHVAFGAIQEQSTSKQNYLRDGFYAATRAEEMEAPGYTVAVPAGTEDVTDRVLAGVKDETTGIERYTAIDRITKEIVAESEKNTGLRCRVVPMFGGKQYVKYLTLELRDVRIVYVPPEAIGNYGGEVDNWIWPRHTGDFSFLRAYVGPDGAPADFSEKNVPYKPKTYLPLSSAGVKEGDLILTVGFSGNTERYISSFDLADQIEFSYPNRIKASEDEIKIIEEIGARDPEIALREAEDLKGIYNRLKKNRGIMDGLKRTHALERKIEEERGLTSFMAADPSLQKEFGSVLPELESLYRERQKTQLLGSRLGRLARSSDFFRLASDLYRWAVEREKPDMERNRGYQERDVAPAQRRQKTAQINLVPAVDRVLFRKALGGVLALPPDQKVGAVEKLFSGKTGSELDQALDQFVDDLLARTQVGDLDERLKMFSMSRNEIEGLGDPFIDLAAALYPEMEKMRDRDRAFEGAESRLAPKLVQAYAAWKKERMYPDANGTMRISFGEVRGYSPRDGVQYRYGTTLTGVMEKETGEEPFIVPAELKAAYARRDFGGYLAPGETDIPVDFLTTNDITNGNSGSPVINGRGEIAGLAFDGNYEAVASDYLYDGEMNRTIVVDTRYILFLLDKVYRLKSLREELTVR